jgi:RNase P subunit RPR2
VFPAYYGCLQNSLFLKVFKPCPPHQNMGKENREVTKKRIEEFFETIETKKPEEIRKMKKLAMAHNLKLGEKRKKFCQKCYSTKLKVKKIKKGIKTVECESCGNLMRWKIKS